MRQKIASITQRFRLPAICVLCKQFQRTNYAVCEDCLKLFQKIGNPCQYCAYPLPPDTLAICGFCIQEKPYFDRAFIAYRYEEPLRTLIHQFKYQDQLYLGSLLTSLMLDAQKANMERPECFLPIPLHPGKIKERGFNQAALLTQLLAKKLALPHLLNHCQKMVNTKPQASLDGKERRSNLRNAFRVSPLPFKHIALVDDLLTTGSTANELARCLKKTGVEKVDIWCCARAVLN